jgi:hypothetical protein
MLTPQQSALWAAYLHAEARAPRGQKLAALVAFLDALAASRDVDWHPWARDLARRVVDGGEDLVIRTPLFERAVFPALLAGHRESLPGCARWLAGLAQHLYRCPACLSQLPAGVQSEFGLLRAAVRVDPTDHVSRRRLIDHIAGRLKHSLHELPSGVLYGMDGATPDECLELQAELDEFESLLGVGPGPDYRSLVTDCRFHFRAYRAFLLSREPYGTYAEYLARHPPGHDQRP